MIIKHPERAEMLIALRAKLNLSQMQFAQMYGIPKPTIQGWEQGRRSISDSRWRDIIMLTGGLAAD